MTKLHFSLVDRQKRVQWTVRPSSDGGSCSGVSFGGANGNGMRNVEMGREAGRLTDGTRLGRAGGLRRRGGALEDAVAAVAADPAHRHLASGGQRHRAHQQQRP